MLEQFGRSGACVVRLMPSLKLSRFGTQRRFKQRTLGSAADRPGRCKARCHADTCAGPGDASSVLGLVAPRRDYDRYRAARQYARQRAMAAVVDHYVAVTHRLRVANPLNQRDVRG